MLRCLSTLLFLACQAATFAVELDVSPLEPFLEEHCYECHDDLTSEAGLDLYSLSRDLSSPESLAQWIRIYDRVENGEMPPEKKPRPSNRQLATFSQHLSPSLSAAHAAEKGTVLRRLNRQEYENTLNDMFGLNLDLASMLPEDGRSHEFDNVGESLGFSMVQMHRYLDAAKLTIESAIADTLSPPESELIIARYGDDPGEEKFFEDHWLRAPDDSVVFFQALGYPDGQLRQSQVRTGGKYRVRINGYAYQSNEPVTFVVRLKTFKRGLEYPTVGYFEMPPSSEPATVEFESWIDEGYMVQIQPMGIFRTPQDRKARKPAEYDGPGLAISSVEIEGPIVSDFPGEGHQLVFGKLKRNEKEPNNPSQKSKPWYRPSFEIRNDDAVPETLSAFASRAFRRTVSIEELSPYLDLYHSEKEKGATIEESLVAAEMAILCAPDFLYLKETPGKLNDDALATRLSYFLTRTLPDDRLLAAAISTRPENLRAETDRLLDDERFERFIKDFTDAWLDLREIDFTTPDKKLFPEFDPYLQYSMLEETREFLATLIKDDLPVRNLVKSDFAMLNERLALHYDLPPVEGPSIRRVRLPAESVRGGFLSQGSILKVSANGTNTSPVLRGVWVLERMLGVTPPPPPPGTPGVEPDIRGAETLRELLDKHRNMTSCQGCHQQIDPPGFALESFNPVGAWRERFRTLGAGDKVNQPFEDRRSFYKLGAQVDSSGEFQTGEVFSGFREFRDLLAEDEERLAETLVVKLLTFATGREMGFSDRAEIDQIVQKSARNGHGVRNLFHLITSSEIFLHK